MRLAGNILLHLGVGLAVVFCTALAVIVGMDSPMPAAASQSPEFKAYSAPSRAESDETNTATDTVEQSVPGQSRTTSQKTPRELKSAVLQVVTNFEKADVTINGIPYPEYFDPGEPEGIVLPAGGPYDVRVTYSGKVKYYNIYLRPNETRLLFVELTGFQGGAPPPPSKASAAQERKVEEPKREEGKEPGKVTVYAKPQGLIMVDGSKTSEKTPGTVEVENGRHEIQVEYEGGEISEKKIVRVRDGSKIKIFFRQRTTAPE